MQGSLFAVEDLPPAPATDVCDDTGHVGPRIDGEPIDYGPCINVETRCAACGVVLCEVSISKVWVETEDEARGVVAA